MKFVLPWLFDAVSLEWLLRFYPNGGFVIFLRSLSVTVLLFALGLALTSVPEAKRPLEWSYAEFASLLSKNTPWLGAIFAGAYAVFYSRYAGQWSYLANLYNQIMATQVVAQSGAEDGEPFIRWQVGFIDDAITLHLHRKALFSGVILSMIARPKVMDEFLLTIENPVKVLRELGYGPHT